MCKGWSTSSCPNDFDLNQRSVEAVGAFETTSFRNAAQGLCIQAHGYGNIAAPHNRVIACGVWLVGAKHSKSEAGAWLIEGVQVSRHKR